MDGRPPLRCLAFAVMMPITMNRQKVFSVYGFVLMAAALAVFLIYQLIATAQAQADADDAALVFWARCWPCSDSPC